MYRDGAAIGGWWMKLRTGTRCPVPRGLPFGGARSGPEEDEIEPGRAS